MMSSLMLLVVVTGLLSSSAVFATEEGNVNTSNSSNTTTLHVILVKSHGSIMMLSWAFLVLMAIFTASWMRPVFKKDCWFQVHLTLNLTAFVTTVIGLILIIVANRNNNPPGLVSFNRSPVVTTHALVGFTIMILITINPILGFFRPSVYSRWRSIFYSLHGLGIGYGALLLSFVNISLGLYLFSKYLLAVFQCFVIFIIIVETVMIVTFTILACRGSGPDRQAIGPTMLRTLMPSNEEYADMEEENGVNNPAMLVHCNLNVFLRWLAFFLVLCSSTGVVILLIGLLAFM